MALGEARKRAMVELDDDLPDDSVQMSQNSDAAHIAWLHQYQTPLDNDSLQEKVCVYVSVCVCVCLCAYACVYM